jgi:dephospho-CoA kinase
MNKKREFKKNRKKNEPKIIIVTGSIGMGKSTTTSLYKFLGYPYFDSDFYVKKISRFNSPVFKKISAVFPNVILSKKIDRESLGKIVFSNKGARLKLEKIIHPIIKKEKDKFFKFHKLRRSKVVIFDVPLLFELRQEKKYNNIIVNSAPSFVQRQRVLKRKGMTMEKFNNILKIQTTDALKRKYCKHLIQSGLGKRFVLNKLKKIKSSYK